MAPTMASAASAVPAAATSPVPMLTAHQSMLFLGEVGLLLALALAFGRLAARFGLPALVGELSVGLLLGPSVLGGLAPGLTGALLPHDPAQVHLLDALGQFGVLLVVGVTGMQLELRSVRRHGANAARVSAFGLLVPLGLGVAAGFVLAGPLGFRPHAHGGTTVGALFLGVAMGVSAIPVVAKTLTDMNLLHREIGQLTLTAAVVDDLVGWILLAVVSAMATTGVDGAALAAQVGELALVAIAAFAARPLLRRLLRWAGAAGSAGPTVALVTALLLGGGVATQAAGMEPVLGAFVTGMALGSCGGIEPARLAPLNIVVMSVLGPLFFALAGLRADLTALASPGVLAAAIGVFALAVLGKFGGVLLGSSLSGLGRWETLALGAGLNARGVIEVIVAMVGLRLGVLGTNAYTVIILVALGTSMMAPPVLRCAFARIEDTAEERRRAEFLAAAGLGTPLPSVPREPARA